MHVSCDIDAFTDNVLVLFSDTNDLLLIENLSDEEIAILTLAGVAIIKVNSDDFSAYLRILVDNHPKDRWRYINNKLDKDSQI